MDAKVHIWFQRGWWYASRGQGGPAISGRLTFQSLAHELADPMGARESASLALVDRGLSEREQARIRGRVLAG